MAVALEWIRRDHSTYSTSTREAPEKIHHNLEFGQDEGFQTLQAQSTRALAALLPRPSRSSLKSPDKLPRKNSNRVRFADTLGISLTSVQWIEPVGLLRPVPSRCHTKRDESSRHSPRPALTLKPTRLFQFPQPGRQSDFFTRVLERKVLLESIRAEGPALHGIVRVVKMKHAKDICVIWTKDHWKTTTAITCSYCKETVCLDGTHKYRFTLPANRDNIEFAIRYRCAKRHYWDNNDGQNYVTVVGYM